MKPLQIVLLVAAAGIGGALVMKMSQSRQPEPVPVAVQTQTAEQIPAAPPQTAPALEEKPSPLEPRPAAQPAHERTTVTQAVHKPAPPRRQEPSREAPVHIASAEPIAEPATLPAPEPVAAPPTPAPKPVAPARTEPEHVTLPPPPPPPEPHKVTLNAGTLLQVRLVDGLSTDRNMAGDQFTGTLDRELVVDGFVLAERGARVEGRVVTSDRGGRVSGVASLGVELTRLHLSDGQTITIQTDSFERRAEQTHSQDAVKVGAGAAIGAVIGAIAGGGKGAAIGAGAGGAAGAGTVMATRGRGAALPSETRIPFRLHGAVTVTERRL